MGKKGAKLNPTATAQASTNEAAALIDDLLPMGLPLGDLQARRMFGGYGVFANGVMFALIDPDGVAHLRAGPDTQPRFEAAGSVKHARMPLLVHPGRHPQRLRCPRAVGHGSVGRGSGRQEVARAPESRSFSPPLRSPSHRQAGGGLASAQCAEACPAPGPRDGQRNADRSSRACRRACRTGEPPVRQAVRVP